MRNDFDGKKVKEEIISWIKEYFEKTNGKGAVVGISGGKDSTVVSKLLVEALGKERVFAVLMPNGEQKDIADSKRVVEGLGVEYKIVNIEKAYKGFLEEVEVDAGFEITAQPKTNIPPRLRMTTLYAIAGTLGYMVAGTGNKSEAFVGYSTKWGDGAHDFNPIADLTTEEVVAVGEALGLPEDLIKKAPSDGLTGKTDEDNLGFTYNQINEVIDNGTCGDKELDERILRRHSWNKHKVEPIPYCKVK